MRQFQGCAQGHARNLGSILVVTLLAGVPSKSHGQSFETFESLETEPESSPAYWFPLFTVKWAAGYNDNVLLSDANQQESAYLGGGLEMFLSGLPDQPTVWDVFISFDDRHYLEPVDVDKEQIGFAQAHWQHHLGGGTEFSLELQYIYQDQVLDVSVTEADLDILQVIGHAWITDPALRHHLVPGVWTFEAAFPIERQWFEEPLDDYLEFGPEIRLIRHYRYQSQCRLGFGYQNRDYDTNELLTSDGLSSIPGTTRTFHQNEVELLWQHYWDANRRWRSTTRLGYKLNRDTGSGYFDFNRYQIRHELRCRVEPWLVSAEIRYADYYYPVQTANPGASERYRRDEWRFALRLERALTRQLRAFVELDREETNSNNPIENYTVQTATGGLTWDW